MDKVARECQSVGSLWHMRTCQNARRNCVTQRAKSAPTRDPPVRIRPEAGSIVARLKGTPWGSGRPNAYAQPARPGERLP